jgi:phage terminase Nu1 subunit (DNA packaging protein)
MATVSELAAHLGISPKYVQDLIAKGVIRKAARGSYDLDSCRKSYIDQLREQAAGRATTGSLILADERARLAKEQADAKEMENAVERGDLVYIEDVAKQIENQLTKVRTRLLSVPTKVAPEAHSCASVREVQAVIEQAIVEALNELVGYTESGSSEEA